jgi:hypothetical protein
MGVSIVYNNRDQATGEAFVEFSNADDLQVARPDQKGSKRGRERGTGEERWGGEREHASPPSAEMSEQDRNCAQR